MAFEIKDQFNINLRNKPELKDALQALADDYNLQSPLELLTHLLKEASYMDGKASKKAVKEEKKPTNEVFFAKIHRMDKDLVNQMRTDLYQDHRYEDPQIIAHWAKVHQLIRSNQLFMVKPAKSIAAKIVEVGQPLVDNGDVPSLGHFISSVCKQQLMKPVKKEGGIWG